MSGDPFKGTEVQMYRRGTGQRYWPATKEAHAHMKMRQRQNIEQSRHSSAETWMAAKLKTTGMKWTRQAQSGVRVFDFWNHVLGIAVEVDGPEHDEAREKARDYMAYQARGIVVLRVKNFDEVGADLVLRAIAVSDTWNVRRATLGLKAIA